MDELPSGPEPIFFIFVNRLGNAFEIFLKKRGASSSIYIIGIIALKRVSESSGYHKSFEVTFEGSPLYYKTPSGHLSEYDQKEFSDRIFWDWIEGTKYRSG